MKYCKVCKLRAAEADTVCAKCGGPVSALMIGQGDRSATTGGAPAPPALTLQGQINELQAARTLNTRRYRILAGISLGLAFALCIVMYEIYAYTVLSYAVLKDVQIEQDTAADSLIRVSFNVVRPGKVAFDRISGGRHTEKVDVFTAAGPQKLSWSWPSDRETGVDFRVVFREWLTRTSADRHFNVTGKKSGAVDIVFLLDTTNSMDPFIEGLRKKCIEFAAHVRRDGYDCRLGLIGFGDVKINEPMQVFEPTRDLQLFQTEVAEVRRTNGGDLPESSVEALRKALTMQFRGGANVCFVHITDAACHNEQQITPLSQELKERGVITYVVSLRDHAKLYQPLCVNGGEFYAIEDAKFDDILLKVAKSIADQIGYR